MDFDIASIKKAIGMQSEDVEENDDDMMAELLALEGGDETRTTISAGSRPVQTPSAAGTSKTAGFQVPIPARRTTASQLPKAANSALPHLDFDSAEVEVSEADLHNDDLLSELDALVGNVVDNKKANKPAPPPTQVARNIPPSQPPPALKIHREDEAAEPQKSTPAPPPPLPPRTSSIATPTPISSEIHQHQPKPPTEEPNSDNVPDDPSQTSLETRAQSLLLRRRKLYLERAKAAKEANDRSAAVDAFETVKLFNQALEAMKEGAQLSEEDLEQIPPTPPPYAPQSEKPQQLPDSSELPGSSGMSNPEAKSQIPSKPVEKSSATEKHPPKETMPVYMSEELKLVVMRQQQLRQAALVAKQRGDLQGAKELLTLALRMDKMVEAAKCGLPIDVQQIPSAPSTSHAMPSSVSRKSSLNPETLKTYQLLEKELLKQIDMCADKMLQFQSIGDSRNVLFYESLQQNSKKDLQSVQMAMLGNSRLPNFKFVELFMPNVEVNPSIPDDQLQLKILKIEKLKLPESWKPTDCSLFVVYDFPYPHSAHQTGRTSVVKGAAVTEFPDVFHLNIKRKNPQFARIGKKTLKMEIYHKGGFLRSDKNFGHAAIPLQELEQSAHIQGRFDILEGRKKTGGFIHVEIRISKPLGHDTQMSAAAGVKRKWIKLDSA